MSIGTSRTKSVQLDPAHRHSEFIAEMRRWIRDGPKGDDEWQSRRRFNEAVAAAIRDLDHPSLATELRDEISALAGSVGNCRWKNSRCAHDMKGRIEVFHCDRWLLCNWCANRRAWTNALLDSARVMEVYAADPSMRFLMLTLTAGECDDLAQQYDVITSSLTTLGDRRTGAWGRVRGMIWFIEYAKGHRGMWRSHVHAIVAVHDSSEDAQHALLLAWVKLVRPGSDFDEQCEALVNQHSQEFRTHGDDDKDFARTIQSLGRDAYGVSSYASKQPRLSIQDRLEAYVLVGGRRSRQPTGVFWGHKEKDLKARIAQIGKGALSIRGERGGIPSTGRTPKTRAHESYELGEARREQHRHWREKGASFNDKGIRRARVSAPQARAEGPKHRRSADRRLVDGPPCQPANGVNTCSMRVAAHMSHPK